MGYDQYRLTDAEYNEICKHGTRIKTVLDAQIEKVLRMKAEEVEAMRLIHAEAGKKED